MTKGHSPKVHHSLLSVLHALRADSADAPETHKEAVKIGPPWPAAIAKEFANHEQNSSWRTIPRSEMPTGRRLHKFVWVFKLKCDGTAKARLCVNCISLVTCAHQGPEADLDWHGLTLCEFRARKPHDARHARGPVNTACVPAHTVGSRGLSLWCSQRGVSFPLLVP